MLSHIMENKNILAIYLIGQQFNEIVCCYYYYYYYHYKYQ
jgi:hypothetical protein